MVKPHQASAHGLLSGILARLYITRMADLLAGERLDAAKKRMDEIGAFYADASTRWAQKPLDVTFADAYLAYGRGLYNLGEVGGGVAALEKAQKLAPSPAVTEEQPRPRATVVRPR